MTVEVYRNTMGRRCDCRGVQGHHIIIIIIIVCVEVTVS